MNLTRYIYAKSGKALAIKTSVLMLTLVITTTGGLRAQELLTIDEAVNRALKNNFDIQIARNNADIDRINNTAGNAGMLPTVALNGTGGYQNNDVHQRTLTAGDTHYSGLAVKTLTSNIELNWKLYDGGKMFVTRRKLNEIEALGQIQFRGQVTQTLYNVIAAYYDVVCQKQQLKAINEAISYNRERLKIAQISFTSGASAKTEYLQAKIDLNTYTENAINQQTTIDAAKRTLKALLAETPDVTFDVQDTIPLNYIPDRADLEQKIFSANTSVLNFQKQIEIARLSLKETKSAVLPQLGLRTGYYLSFTDNSNGTTLKNHTVGPQIAGTLSIPLFTGGENKRKINTAQVEIKSAEANLESIKLQINTELQNALTQYDNQKRLLEIERENNLLTKENLTISMERLRLGQTTSLEVHQAQESYVQSSTRLTNFQFNMKLAETKLMQLLAAF